MEPDSRLKSISITFNRSLNQANFLFELCNKDYYKYIQLEMTMNKLYINYCPGDKETVTELLNRYYEISEDKFSKKLKNTIDFVEAETENKIIQNFKNMKWFDRLFFKQKFEKK